MPQLKQRLRANNRPHMNKTLRKAIILRTNFKNIANKTKREQEIRKFKDQRNLVVKLNVKAKKDYFKSIQSKSIENDKQFWKTAFAYK